MKLVSYNIQYGFGGDGRYDLARAARIVGSAPYHPGAAYADGFVDAVAVAEEPSRDFHTHEKVIAGELKRRRLDHCFVTGDMAARVRSIDADIGEPASDHFPLRVEVDLETPFAAGRSARP